MCVAAYECVLYITPACADKCVVQVQMLSLVGVLAPSEVYRRVCNGDIHTVSPMIFDLEKSSYVVTFKQIAHYNLCTYT